MNIYAYGDLTSEPTETMCWANNLCKWYSKLVFLTRLQGAGGFIHVSAACERRSIYLCVCSSAVVFNILRGLCYRLMALLALALVLVAGPAYILGQPADGNDLEARDVTLMQSLQESWYFRLMLNVMGYGRIMLPGYLLIRWIRSSNYLDHAG